VDGVSSIIHFLSSLAICLLEEIFRCLVISARRIAFETRLRNLRGNQRRRLQGFTQAWRPALSHHVNLNAQVDR
jgi:hypothetical protein